MLIETFTQRLKRIRAAVLDSQHEAARKLGISEAYYWRLENGRTRPSRQLVDRIAIAYRQDANELWALVESEGPVDGTARPLDAGLREVQAPDSRLTQLVFGALVKVAGRLGATTPELMETMRDGLVTIARNEITPDDTNAIRALIQQLQGQLALTVEHRLSTGGDAPQTFAEELVTLGTRRTLESFYATLMGEQEAARMMDAIEAGVRPKVFVSHRGELDTAKLSGYAAEVGGSITVAIDEKGDLRPLTKAETQEEDAQKAQFKANPQRFVREALQHVSVSNGWGELQNADFKRIPSKLTFEQTRLLCREVERAMKRWDSRLKSQPSLFSFDEIRPPIERVINEAVIVVLVQCQRDSAEQRRDEVCELWAELIEYYFDQFEEYVEWCILNQLPVHQLLQSSMGDLDFLNEGPGEADRSELLEQIDSNISLLYHLSQTPASNPQS